MSEVFSKAKNSLRLARYDYQELARKKVRDFIGLNEYEIETQKEGIANKTKDYITWNELSAYLDRAQLELVINDPEVATIDAAIVRSLSDQAKETLAHDQKTDIRLLEALATDRSSSLVWHTLIQNPSLTKKCLVEAWQGVEVISKADYEDCAKCYLKILQTPKANEQLYILALNSFFGSHVKSANDYLPHQKQHLITRAKTFARMLEAAPIDVQSQLLDALISHTSIPTISWQVLKDDKVLARIINNHPALRARLQAWERTQRRYLAESNALAEFSTRG